MTLAGAAAAQTRAGDAGSFLSPRPMADVDLSVFAAPPRPGTAQPALKAEARPMRDVVTLGDLVENAPAHLAATALFRAPRLGESGTIEASRALDAVRALGIAVEANGIGQIMVTRAARRITSSEIEAAIAARLAARTGLDARALSLVFEGTPPQAVLPIEISGPLQVEDINHDPRARRVVATVAVAAPDGSQRRPIRVTATVVETAEIAVLTRAVGRGEAVNGADITVERRPRDSVPADALADPRDVAGRIARRALGPGMSLRAGDLAKPEIVARGEMVTLVYEVPGMMLTARGKASEAGGIGDVIPVLNPQSKRTVQATIAGPGRVTVTAPLTAGQIAAASTAAAPLGGR